MNHLSEKIRKTIRYYLKVALIDFRSLLYSINKKRLEQPIFVIGCSRAGTTLVYKTFSESRYLGSLQKETHDFWMGLHPLAERNWNSHAIDRSMASERDRNIVSRYFYIRTGKQRIVDKNNQNGLSVPYLYQLFPDAHFVYIKRNPGDNIDSLIKGWNKSDEFATWSNDLPEELAIDEGKYRRWCFFLAEGWRKRTRASIEEVCAFQYKAMNEAILTAKDTIPAKQWHEIKYESLIADPVGEFEKLFSACLISFDDDIRKHCQDVLNNPYNAFSEIGVEKWKQSPNYEKIKNVLPLVDKTSIKMDY